MSMDQHELHELSPIGHEPIETDVRAVWRTAAVITGVVLATFVLIVGMMKLFTSVNGSSGSSYAAKPDLKWAEQNTLQQLRDEERILLNEYKWIDRTAGVARIPVDRAMEIISQHGLPTQIQGPSAPSSDSTKRSAEARAISPENTEPNEQ
ncbi:MAG TPA: hypothetical protein VHK01_00480 [Lacipirellulaceae bacterium]|jgi:hypothetical protein|nr:hypothetical protein [Lacipirellulaceae bacterium]